MSYYNDVYLKRLNRFGTNIQERIQGKKEYDFQLFKDKSPNKVTVHLDDREDEGVLQIQESNEKEVSSYLLVNKNIEYAVGDIIETIQFVDKKRQLWIVFHLDIFTSIGYNRYQIVELDRNIQWIDEGVVHQELCHITGSGANLRDKSITEKFTIQWDVAAVYLPNKILNLVMKTNSNLKKGTRILVEDEMWKVTGIDKISVPGVSYITLKEDYIDNMTDVKYADSQKLENWTIQCDYGNNIQLTVNTLTKLNFITYYGEEVREEPVLIEIKDEDILKYNGNNIFKAEKEGATLLKICLERAPEVYQFFMVNVSSKKEEVISLLGPEKIRMLDTAIYTITNINNIEFSVETINGLAEIEKIENERITLIGKNIGIEILRILVDNKIVCEKSIKVNSIWLEE